MGRNSTRSAVFAQALRREIEARGFSIRGFGKRVDPNDPERGRRRVQRHLSGRHLPSPQSRLSYAMALGLPGSTFEPDADAEDRSLNARLTSAIRELQALRSEVQEQQSEKAHA